MRLNEIELHVYSPVITCFKNILKEWLNSGDHCTKQQLLQVLRREAISERALAAAIEEDAGIHTWNPTNQNTYSRHHRKVPIPLDTCTYMYNRDLNHVKQLNECQNVTNYMYIKLEAII